MSPRSSNAFTCTSHHLAGDDGLMRENIALKPDVGFVSASASVANSLRAYAIPFWVAMHTESPLFGSQHSSINSIV